MTDQDPAFQALAKVEAALKEMQQVLDAEPWWLLAPTTFPPQRGGILTSIPPSRPEFLTSFPPFRDEFLTSFPPFA